MKLYFLSHRLTAPNHELEFRKELLNHQISVTDCLDDVEDLYLFFQNSGDLCMASRREPKLLPMKVDLLSPKMLRRLQPHSISSELLNKCLGKKHNYETVLDATAGMGTDSMIFAGLGLDVTACEKLSLTYLLLKNGLERALKDEDWRPTAERINLHHADSLTYLASAPPVDVIYLDFMFSSGDKKSKSKKSMQFFQKINPSTEGREEDVWLEAYLQFSFRRLIYKKPIKSPVLKTAQYSHSVKGKAIRFDIYVA